MGITPDAVENAAMETIARHLHQVAYKHAGQEHVEIEMRLCHFDFARPPKSKETYRILKPGQSKNKITVGVTAAQFHQIKAAVTAVPPETGESAEKKVKLEAAVATAPSASPLVEESTTEDVTVGSSRYTYRVVPANGAERKVPQAMMRKRRLEVIDVRLFDCPYDVRLSISAEVPSTTAELPPADPPKGYTRRKVRTSVTLPAQHVRYDLTWVRAGRDETYEVELEGVFDDVKSQLTEQWVAEALKNLMQWSQPTK